MKIPLRYQISEYDCGPTSLLNAMSFLFQREEISPELIRNIMLYSLDSYGSGGVLGKSGTSRMAMTFLSNWLDGAGKTGILPITSRHLSGKDYNVIIVDWKMPEIDGLETIRRIRSEIKTTVPILLISAYDWSDIEDKAKAAGANGFVSKPIFRSTLYNKINELIGEETQSFEPEDDYSDIEGMHILIAEDINIKPAQVIKALLF